MGVALTLPVRARVKLDIDHLDIILDTLNQFQKLPIRGHPLICYLDDHLTIQGFKMVMQSFEFGHLVGNNASVFFSATDCSFICFSGKRVIKAAIFHSFWIMVFNFISFESDLADSIPFLIRAAML